MPSEHRSIDEDDHEEVDEDNEKSVSRTNGALFVANQCMKVFFALNTLKHVKSLVLPPMMQVSEFSTPGKWLINDCLVSAAACLQHRASTHAHA